MAESIFKSGRKKGFVVLYRDAAQDTRLSLESHCRKIGSTLFPDWRSRRAVAGRKCAVCSKSCRRLDT